MQKIISLCEEAKKTKINLEKIRKRESQIKELFTSGVFTYETGEKRVLLHEDIFYSLIGFLDKETRQKEYRYITNLRYTKFNDIISYSEDRFYECARYLNEKYNIIKNIQYDNFKRSTKLQEYLKFFEFHMLQKEKTIVETDDIGVQTDVTIRSPRSMLSMYIALLPFKDKFMELEIMDLHQDTLEKNFMYDDRIKSLFKRYDLKNKFIKYNKNMTKDKIADMLKI